MVSANHYIIELRWNYMMIGEKRNMLTLIKDIGKRDTGKRNRHFILCKCECGNEVMIRIDQFGKNHSCGCIKKEVATLNVCRNHKHKKSGTRLYSIWSGMKERCRNKNNSRYHRYGERGIGVCDEWLNDFVSFAEWALNDGYSKNKTLDRIDNNGNYEPQNCRWASQKEQANNRETNINIAVDKKEFDLMQLSEIFNLPYSTVYARYKRGDRGNQLIRPLWSIIRPRNGEKNSKAKITEEQAKEIKLLIKQGHKCTAIAKHFNVSKYLIYEIKGNKTWNHVQV